MIVFGTDVRRPRFARGGPIFLSMSGAVYLIAADGRELFGLDDPSRKRKRSRYPLIDALTAQSRVSRTNWDGSSQGVSPPIGSDKSPSRKWCWL